MKSVLLLLVHLIVSLVKLAGPGGARGLLAETLLLKHQLLIVNRGRKRAPNLSTWDRLYLRAGLLADPAGRYPQNRHHREPSNFAEVSCCTGKAEVSTPLFVIDHPQKTGTQGTF